MTPAQQEAEITRLLAALNNGTAWIESIPGTYAEVIVHEKRVVGRISISGPDADRTQVYVRIVEAKQP